MQEITGRITELGPTSISFGFSVYSYIVIDGKTITGLKVNLSLGSYVYKGQLVGGHTTLYLHKNIIVGVKVANDKTLKHHVFACLNVSK